MTRSVQALLTPRGLLAVALLGVAAAALSYRAGQASVEPATPPAPPLRPADGGQEPPVVEVPRLDQPARVRQQLLATLFEGGVLPREVPELQRVSAALSVPPEALDALQLSSGGVLLRPAGRPLRCALLYHAGHGQRALDDGRELIRAALGAGASVLAMDMPAEPHSRFASLARPLDPFLRPVAHGVNLLSTLGHGCVVMAGLSGGGWTTTLYAALDERVRVSVPVAGSWPFALRQASGRPGSIGDFEQRLPTLDIDYPALYVLGTTGGRVQVQVFNDRDPCCFEGSAHRSYAGAVAAEAARHGGSFAALTIASDRHDIGEDARQLLAVLLQQEEARQPR